MFDNIKEFTVTEQHIKLLRAMYWEWDDNYSHGSPLVNQKRPYGNSYIYPDIQEILGIEMELEDEGYTDEQVNFLREIHQGTKYALEIFLSTGTMEPGNYKVVSSTWAHKTWRKV